MRKDYRVNADKVHKYVVTVNADSPDVAWEAAKGIPEDKWLEVHSEDPLELYSVEEI